MVLRRITSVVHFALTKQANLQQEEKELLLYFQHMEVPMNTSFIVEDHAYQTWHSQIFSIISNHILEKNLYMN